jgi:hypothetical protein
VVQAWESVKQGEQAVRQGRNILVFTIITIIFVSGHYPHSLRARISPVAAPAGIHV